MHLVMYVTRLALVLRPLSVIHRQVGYGSECITLAMRPLQCLREPPVVCLRVVSSPLLQQGIVQISSNDCMDAQKKVFICSVSEGS